MLSSATLIHMQYQQVKFTVTESLKPQKSDQLSDSKDLGWYVSS